MHAIYRFIKLHAFRLVFIISAVSIISCGFYLYSLGKLSTDVKRLGSMNNSLQDTTSSLSAELAFLKSQDQYVINKDLNDEVKNINSTYKKAMLLYESYLDLKTTPAKRAEHEGLFAEALSLLAERKYASADAVLKTLSSKIDAEKQTSPSGGVPAASVTSNAPPSSGYSRQRVKADIGEYVLDIVSADLGSTRVIVDTASDGDCRDNCPVLSLGDYVARSGAFAGINGSYFCPASYPTCAGKTNSFDTLLMNKNKTYFNSDNNVYSTVPVAVFGNGWARFIGRSLDWGRATDVDGVIANQPLLLSGGNIAFGGDGDPKKGSKGSRSFVGNKGNIVYIGVVHNVTVAEAAHVLKALGLENALNLDSGGSTALWSGGYKVGPGRNIPNALLFVRR